MKIAIDASPAFKHLRTGIEEYSYQIIKHLREPLKEHHVTLYIRGGTRENVDFALPEMWRVREIRSPRLWTYLRFSFELLVRRYDRLFVPGHIVPPIHPKNTTVVVHGLEYEIVPESFTAKERKHMRFGITKSCKWSRFIICVSNNTKKDLIRLYDVPREKIRVIYEGVNQSIPVTDKNALQTLENYRLTKNRYLLFIGRIEHRKNIIGILKAFEILKSHFHIPHKMVLVGRAGHGWEDIKVELASHPNREDIVMTGFVKEQEKWALMRYASTFVFPTFYEGFGLPVLEAQQLDVPVVTSQTSALGEIARKSALLVDPKNTTQIAEYIYSTLTDKKILEEIVVAGRKNVERFSWQKCARLTAKVILAGGDTAKK